MVIVTHNANIAVLGDAEQIIVLKGQDDTGLARAFVLRRVFEAVRVSKRAMRDATPKGGAGASRQ